MHGGLMNQIGAGSMVNPLVSHPLANALVGQRPSQSLVPFQGVSQLQGQ
jgi:hypothetical protein